MSSWRQVEDAIFKEIRFLQDNIVASPYRQNDPINCPECLFRSIAILCVSGRISIKKYDNIKYTIRKSGPLQTKRAEKSHGKDWHNDKIHELKEYFEDYKTRTINEPNMFYGRCDLGLPDNKTFIEIGSVNTYKLFMNLSNMSDCKLFYIPNDEYILLFEL